MSSSTNTSFEQWKSDWSVAFTPEAISSTVTMSFPSINRTFVRVQMLSKGMMKIWFDLLKRNHPRLITASQLSSHTAGPCRLFMCYFTTNHVDFRDPTAISCATPMYTNAPLICFQGLMELNSTLKGAQLNPNEPISLLIISAKTAPRDEKMAFLYIFISPKPCIGKELRQLLDAEDINYNRCVAGTLHSVFHVHTKGRCNCSLSVDNWKEIGIKKDYQISDKIVVVLPTISFKGVKMGMINVPWASGRAFDLGGKNNWVVEDEGIAALTQHWLTYTNALESHARTASFLSVLAGIDGIHAIDFIKFVMLDPFTPPKQQQQGEEGEGGGAAAGAHHHQQLQPVEVVAAADEGGEKNKKGI
jgi:hypothetical protein